MSDPYEPKNPNTQIYLIGRKIQEWSPLITLGISIVALAVIFGQAVIYYRQARIMQRTLDEMKSGSQVTERMARTASDQANAMQGQLDTMRDQANSMKVQTNTLKDSLAETRKAANAAVTQANASMSQAGTSKVSAEAAKVSALAAEKMAGGNRAFISVEKIQMSVFEQDKEIVFFITWKNDGNSPAEISKSLTKIGVSPLVPNFLTCDTGKNIQPLITVSPRNIKGQRFIAHLPADAIRSVKEKRAYFWFCGRVVYETLGKQYSFPICSYTSDLELYVDCNEGRQQ